MRPAAGTADPDEFRRAADNMSFRRVTFGMSPADAASRVRDMGMPMVRGSIAVDLGLIADALAALVRIEAEDGNTDAAHEALHLAEMLYATSLRIRAERPAQAAR